MLNNDSLLQIFIHYRLESEDDWTSRLGWRMLAHVCQRWRCLVFNFWFNLDVCLLLTTHSPSIDTLSHLPPLPLFIEFSTDKVKRWGTEQGTDMFQEENDKIRFGLQQHDRVLQVNLRAPSTGLRMCLELMNKPFPRLGDLSLFSTTTDEMSLVLPETFQAPNLRRLSLHGIGLPKGLSLLSSTNALSTLSFTHIRESFYFSPVDLVTRLHYLPHLEELSIGFATPMPLPSSEGELLPAPIPPVTLPALRRLTFRGVDVYLDSLVERINAPLLERVRFTLLFDLDFTFVNLTKFIHMTKGLGYLVAKVNFNKDGASIKTGYREQWDIGEFSLQFNVNCKRLDWQMDSATQVCSALGNVLSAVEELTLDLNEDWLPSDWNKTLDNAMWHELLLPFTGVKKLHVGSSLTLELSKALESVAGGLVLELLPELQELEVQLEIDYAKNAFSGFVETRESVGRPVHLLAPPIPRADPEMYRIDSKLFLEDMKNIGRQYRYRAMNLISICQTFVKAQEPTFHSYDELRR
jgi:hypothetical protein